MKKAQCRRAGDKGGQLTDPNPVDRGKAGSKYHLLTNAGGLPLSITLSAANTHDALLLEPLIEAVPAIVGPRGRPGQPRRRPAKLDADNGYDYACCQQALRHRGITARIARRGVDSSSRVGRHRWVVERTQAWLLGFRWLQVRYQRSADLLVGLLHLACALICARTLKPL